MRSPALVGVALVLAAASCCFPEANSCVVTGPTVNQDRCVVLHEVWCWDPEWERTPAPLTCIGERSTATCQERGFAVDCGDGSLARAGSGC